MNDVATSAARAILVGSLVGATSGTKSKCFSIAGITGTAAPDISSVGAHVARIKAHTDLPIAIGFGVKTKQDVTTVAPHVDGVVVGSAVVSAIENAASRREALEAVRALVGELAQGLGRQ